MKKIITGDIYKSDYEREAQKAVSELLASEDE